MGRRQKEKHQRRQAEAEAKAKQKDQEQGGDSLLNSKNSAIAVGLLALVLVVGYFTSGFGLLRDDKKGNGKDGDNSGLVQGSGLDLKVSPAAREQIAEDTKVIVQALIAGNKLADEKGKPVLYVLGAEHRGAPEKYGSAQHARTLLAIEGVLRANNGGGKLVVISEANEDMLIAEKGIVASYPSKSSLERADHDGKSLIDLSVMRAFGDRVAIVYSNKDKGVKMMPSGDYTLEQFNKDIANSDKNLVAAVLAQDGKKPVIVVCGDLHLKTISENPEIQKMFGAIVPISTSPRLEFYQNILPQVKLKRQAGILLSSGEAQLDAVGGRIEFIGESATNINSAAYVPGATAAERLFEELRERKELMPKSLVSAELRNRVEWGQKELEKKVTGKDKAR